MKYDEAEIDKILDQSLAVHRDIPPEDVRSSVDRVWENLRPGQFAGSQSVDSRRVRRWKWPAAAATAAAIIIAVLLPTKVLQSAPATLEDANGTRKIHYGEVVRPSGDKNAVLSIESGSRVEMRSQTEFSLEPTADGGTRIHLKKGDVIVDATGQRNGHLYVQTKDMTASVGRAVSLVNAEAEGSRVAVIEGEVRVQQGSTEKQLRSGDQLSTNPLMKSPSMKEAISWSRHVETHMAMLQSTASQSAPQKSAETGVTFEVTSVRPAGGALPGARGGGPPRTCGLNGPPQVDPRRFAVNGATLYALIGWAYGLADGLGSLGCETVLRLDLLAGGPEWMRSERFDVQAVIPDGGPVYTEAQLIRGEAVRLQRMLQALLADRFKLRLHVESEERPIYVMKVVGDASRYRTSDVPAPWLTEQPTDWQWSGRQAYVVPMIGPTDPAMTVWKGSLSGAEASVTDLARLLARIIGQPVVDRTGVKGQFNFWFRFPVEGPPNNSPVGGILNSADRASLFAALTKELGLAVEATRAPVEILMIDHAERPVAN